MTSNLLVFAFFTLFIIFLIESIYYLKKKMSMGPVEMANTENNQSGGKIVLAGGLIIVVIIIAVSSFFFLSKQKSSTPSTITTSNIPTTIPTQKVLSPTPKEMVYSFPTVTKIPLSPTISLKIKVTPTRIPSPTKTPSLTPSPKILSPTPTIKLAIGAPASPPASPNRDESQGGPNTLSPTISPTKTIPTVEAVVVVPKLPVAGSVRQTLSIIFLGIISILAGLIV